MLPAPYAMEDARIPVKSKNIRRLLLLTFAKPEAAANHNAKLQSFCTLRAKERISLLVSFCHLFTNQIPTALQQTTLS